MAEGISARVITISDEVVAGLDDDRATPVAVELLTDLGLDVTTSLVGDDPDAIRAAITAAVAEGARVVLACGGTGIGPRDHTPEVVRSLLSFEIPGIAEEIRRRGVTHAPQALVSRALAGAMVGRAHAPVLVLAIPGSRGGVRDTVEVVGNQVRYILDQLDGAGHP